MLAPIPIVDLAVFPYELAMLPPTEAVIGHGVHQVPLSESLQELAGPDAPPLEAYVAIYSDAETILPEMASPHYRLWEQLARDPRARFAFGLGPTAAALWESDKDGCLARVEACLDLPDVVAVGLAGLNYGTDPSPEVREGQLRVFVAMAKMAKARKLPFLFELSAGASADGERVNFYPTHFAICSSYHACKSIACVCVFCLCFDTLLTQIIILDHTTSCRCSHPYSHPKRGSACT